MEGKEKMTSRTLRSSMNSHPLNLLEMKHMLGDLRICLNVAKWIDKILKFPI